MKHNPPRELVLTQFHHLLALRAAEQQGEWHAMPWVLATEYSIDLVMWASHALLTNEFKLRPTAVDFQPHPSLPSPSLFSLLRASPPLRITLYVSTVMISVYLIIILLLVLICLVSHSCWSRAQRAAVSTHYPFMPFSDYSFRYNSCCLNLFCCCPTSLTTLLTS